MSGKPVKLVKVKRKIVRIRIKLENGNKNC